MQTRGVAAAGLECRRRRHEVLVISCDADVPRIVVSLSTSALPVPLLRVDCARDRAPRRPLSLRLVRLCRYASRERVLLLLLPLVGPGAQEYECG